MATVRAFVIAAALAMCAIIVSAATRARADASTGDVNCDGEVDAADLVPLIHALFTDNLPTCAASDANGDGRRSSADLIAIVRIYAPPPDGPVVSFLGLATPDGHALSPIEVIAGVPVYQRPVGSGFQLVVEGRPGRNGRRPGSTVFAFDPRNPEQRPDLQVLVDRPLGDGSQEVCSGGVPGVNPPDFAPGRQVSNAINDLGCNFSLSGGGACTVDAFGRPSFVGRGSQVQYCATIARSLAFAPGDTRVAVRLRGVTGVLGPIETIIVRVGAVPPTSTPSLTPTSAPPTSTYTPTVPSTATHSPSATRTPTNSPIATATASASPTSRTPSPVLSPTFTRTRTLPAASATPVRTTPRASATPSPATGTPTASPSRTNTNAMSPTRSPSPTQTRSASPTLTRTPSPTLTTPQLPSPTRTFTGSPTRTRTGSPTPTRTATATVTPSSGTSEGPVVTYFGLTRADDAPIEPSGNAGGIPIFQRPAGAGFSLVIEAKPGSSGRAVGTATYRDGGRPDLQIVASRALGDGSASVCDRVPPNAGGVPGVDPPQFSDAPEIVAALNDFGCRFLDGTGQPRARSRNDACILKADGSFDFARPDSTVQFCGFVDVPMAFPAGDTRVTVRVADTSGVLGPPAQIIIRVGP